MDPQIEALLELQKHDVALKQAQAQLAAFPKEIAELQSKIKDIEAHQAAMHDALKDLEVARKQADMDLKGVEEQIVKYKTQQMEVKKNEDYDRLTKQIEESQASISDYEDRELELLEQIDAQNEAIEAQKAEDTTRIEGLNGQICHIEAQSQEVQSKIDTLEKMTAEASSGIDPAYLSKYQQVSKQVKTAPYVVEVEADRCMGCRLKVSGEVVSSVRKADALVQCDSCSRIVYWAG